MDVLRPHQGEAGALLCRLVSGEAVIPTKVLGGGESLCRLWMVILPWGGISIQGWRGC